MASLTKKVIHGRPYYYLRETARVGGKPKVVRTVYLGRAEDILARLEQRSEPLRAEGRPPLGGGGGRVEGPRGARARGGGRPPLPRTREPLGGDVHHAGGDQPGRLRPLQAGLRRLVRADRACPAHPAAFRGPLLAALLGGDGSPGRGGDRQSGGGDRPPRGRALRGWPREAPHK